MFIPKGTVCLGHGSKLNQSFRGAASPGISIDQDKLLTTIPMASGANNHQMAYFWTHSLAIRSKSTRLFMYCWAISATKGCSDRGSTRIPLICDSSRWVVMAGDQAFELQELQKS